MRIGIFGGSFDPVHSEHIGAVCAAKEYLSLDKVFIVPSHIAPHKRGGANADGADRLFMCRLAFEGVADAEISDLEITGGGTSFTYLTCREFQARYPRAERFFLVGADMLEDFFTWKNPDDILNNVTLAAFGRGDEKTEALRERFYARFHKNFVAVPFCGREVSSTSLRVKLAFSYPVPEVEKRVSDYIRKRGLYSFPSIAPALALEKEERQRHSYRVARMAAMGAKRFGVSESKAILAGAMHDCAKYVPLSSPLLNGFAPPENVPAPVLHQYTGAYLAEHEFGISDEEVLLAIRYHTSGRAHMGALERLIFLADMLEEERFFQGVEELRELFYSDPNACLTEALSRQIAYLKDTGKPVYPLTAEALNWAKTLN